MASIPLQRLKESDTGVYCKAIKLKFFLFIKSHPHNCHSVNIALANWELGHSMSNQHKKNPYPHRFERNLVFTQCLLRY